MHVDRLQLSRRWDWLKRTVRRAPLRIAAILAVHNGGHTLGRVVKHLGNNAIDVIAIDHGSTDATLDILAAHHPHPVVNIRQLSYSGVHEWKTIMKQKVDIVSQGTYDWYLHVDADEIMESPRRHESLRQFIERMDRNGVNVVDCDEFVFVPRSDSEHHEDADFVQTMRHYYHFAPSGRFLQRAIRRDAISPEWANSGGHRAISSPAATSTERIRMRHYMGLSMDDLYAQYLSRVFERTALRSGWHYNRVPTIPEFIIHPNPEHLIDLDREGWRTDRPESKHLIFNPQAPAYKPPPILRADTTRPPLPFVVGVGRSGTTLLRLMLDAHPALAMTPETHWLRDAILSLRHHPDDLAPFRNALLSNEFWVQMGINHEELDALLACHNPEKPFDTLRAIYQSYAARHNATRVGDKTPVHGLWMTEIAYDFPEARFIHIIRDGRDVAISHRSLWFGPGADPRAAAIFWTWRIREMRQQAQFLPNYLEVRYESLIRDPETVLRTIGDFIDLPFDSAQLKAHLRADERLSEVERDASSQQSRDMAQRRRDIHRLTAQPPDERRIGRWKREMSESDLKQFEGIAGDTLRKLGYECKTR